jgi:hypothetical protein
MQQSADAMRRGGGADAGGKNDGRDARGRSGGGPDGSAGAGEHEQIARALDRTAEKLESAAPRPDDESRRLSGQLARAQELRERLESLTRDLERMEQGRVGPGKGGGTPGDLDRLRNEARRQIQEVRDLLRQTEQADEGTRARGGYGFTFEGQGMVLSAPGTEAWKQDFARWQELKRQATLALEGVESTIARKLRERESKDLLAAGVEDKPPAEYQTQVDSYFKALAAKKKP